VVTPDELTVAAIDATGLEEFGDDSFREGLGILVRALDQEARLNAAGETYLYPRLVNHLSQRLQVEDWYRRHPEIEEVEITRPLFGLGLPRTGSTVLSMLLSQDSDVRYLRQWESSAPCPPPSTVTGPDPRRTAAVESVGSKSHVPTGDDGPMECLDLMALDFRTHIYLAFARIPTYADWLLDADLTTTYLYERRVLKLLQWGEPARPWSLKSPAHVLFLPSLDAAFPDARFVMTHRDPTDVLMSVVEVYADIAGVFTDHLDRGYLARLNLEHWATGMERALAFRDAGADDRFYDIDFRAMQGDPIGEVRGLYAWLGRPVSHRFESGMRTWWAANENEREPSVHADPSSAGLDLDEVRPRFAEYVARAERWTAH
jgi:Sulfotransferase family